MHSSTSTISGKMSSSSWINGRSFRFGVGSITKAYASSVNSSVSTLNSKKRLMFLSKLDWSTSRNELYPVWRSRLYFRCRASGIGRQASGNEPTTIPSREREEETPMVQAPVKNKILADYEKQFAGSMALYGRA